MCSPRHPAPSSWSPRRSAESPPGLNGRTRGPAPLCSTAGGENLSHASLLLVPHHPGHHSRCSRGGIGQGGRTLPRRQLWWARGGEGRHLQLPGGLPEDGALLSQPLLLLVLQPFGDADVVLHELVLLNVGCVVVLDYEGRENNKEKKKDGRFILQQFINTVWYSVGNDSKRVISRQRKAFWNRRERKLYSCSYFQYFYSEEQIDFFMKQAKSQMESRLVLNDLCPCGAEEHQLQRLDWQRGLARWWNAAGRVQIKSDSHAAQWCTYSPVPAGYAPTLHPPARRNTGTLKWQEGGEGGGWAATSQLPNKHHGVKAQAWEHGVERCFNFVHFYDDRTRAAILLAPFRAWGEKNKQIKAKQNKTKQHHTELLAQHLKGNSGLQDCLWDEGRERQQPSKTLLWIPRRTHKRFS